MWCVVANVKPEAFGRATSAGTRHFTAGAKIWCMAVHWGDGYENIRVIGRHRGSHQHVAMVIPSATLTNWRARVAYHPEVLRLVVANHGEWRDQASCEDTARFMAKRHPPIENLRDVASRVNEALHLLATDPQGQALERQAAEALATWTPELRKIAALPPIEIVVVSDWLEDRGVAIEMTQLVTTLERRRTNR